MKVVPSTDETDVGPNPSLAEAVSSQLPANAGN